MLSRISLFRLLVLGGVSCLGGISDSLLSPFYTPVAISRGLSVTECGYVISSTFLTEVLFTMVSGSLLEYIGGVTLFMTGTLVFGLFSLAMGSLEWIYHKNTFLILSFAFVIGREISGAGIFSTVYSLASNETLQQNVGEESNENKKEGSVRGPAWMEISYALGTMVGPPFGGLLLELGGFPLTFMFSGAGMILCLIATAILYAPSCSSVIPTASINDSVSATVVADDSHYPTLEHNDSIIPVTRDVKDTICPTQQDKESNLLADSICKTQSVDQNDTITHPTLENNDDIICPTPDASNLSNPVTSYLSILHQPVLLLCCLILINSGITSSWYLSSLQPHLVSQATTSQFTTGLVYMIPGAICTLFTPVWGHYLDKGGNHFLLLVCASTSNLLGYLLLAPALPFLPVNLYVTCLGLLFNGFSLSANPITSLSLMTSQTSATFGHSEALAGKVTSLWVSVEAIGSYIGASSGGICYDRFGFSICTILVAGLQGIVVIVIILFKVFVRREKALGA